MTDFYAKAVLTVIAVALSVIAWNQTFSPAQAQLGAGCSRSFPCYVRIDLSQYITKAIPVRVSNANAISVRVTNLR